MERVFSLKEGANAISEVPARYTTPLSIALEGQMASLHQNWASKGLPKLIYLVDPKRTVVLVVNDKYIRVFLIEIDVR